MKLPKLTFFILLGSVLVGPALARTWTNKEGKQIEAELIKYDKISKKITIKSGGIEQTLALSDFSESDQKWVANHASAVDKSNDTNKDENNAAKVEIKMPNDEIFLLLGKTPAEVSEALKTLKMVEDVKSVKIINEEKPDNGIVMTKNIYDDGKVMFIFTDEKLACIDILLNEGYKGVMPLGLKKEIKQQDARAILEPQGFKLADFGEIPPGWGLAYRLNGAPNKVVSIMTQKPQSPELAVIRIMIRN